MPPVWKLISLFHPISGGDEFIAKWFAEELHCQHGWDVRVLTRRHTFFPDALPTKDNVNGVPIIRVWSRGKVIGSVVHFLGGMFYLLFYGRQSIYHAYDLKVSSWMAIFARFLLGGRAIIKLRSGAHKYRTYYASKLARLYFILPLRLADRIAVVNGEVEQYLNGLGISSEKIVRVPNAVDTNYFSILPVMEKKVDIREMLDLPTNKAIFLYVGRLIELKGVDVLLKGWSLLSDDVRFNSLLLLVGPGDQAYLDEMISALQIEDSVHWVGSQNNVRDYYWASDLFVLASRTEGLSVALLEAMACGLPAIVSRVGGSPDLVQDGENGLLFDSDEHRQLAECIFAMLELPEQWASMGACAREKVVSYADIDVCVAQMAKLYKQLQ